MAVPALKNALQDRAGVVRSAAQEAIEKIEADDDEEEEEAKPAAGKAARPAPAKRARPRPGGGTPRPQP
jgi:hypothetical protein